MSHYNEKKICFAKNTVLINLYESESNIFGYIFKKAIKLRVPIGEVKNIPSYILQVGWLLWMEYPIVMTTTLSLFARIWPLESDLLLGLYNSEQHDECHIWSSFWFLSRISEITTGFGGFRIAKFLIFLCGSLCTVVLPVYCFLILDKTAENNKSKPLSHTSMDYLE